MRKLAALILAALMVCTALGAPAEEGQNEPLYATVGEALAHCEEGRVIAGGEGEAYYAVVTREDGTYYRSVAYYDGKLSELDAAVNNLDFEEEDFFEKLEAAMQAAEAYRNTLPIAYSEAFTAEPLSEEEMASNIGKTLARMMEEGFEMGSNGTEPGEDEETVIVYSMRFGVYDYYCAVDADVDRYIAAQENGTEGDLTVTGMTLAGVTEMGYELRFHTDGTVEEPEDPFAALTEILTEFGKLIEAVQAGEEIDLEAFATTMKEKYPDYADMIDMYVSLFRIYGAEGFAELMTPAE